MENHLLPVWRQKGVRASVPPPGQRESERTGKEFKDWLGCVTATSGMNWVEALPFVQRLYHDTPGPSGYSPHKLVFGRDRHLAGVPYAGTLGKEAEDWFKEMADREKEVGEKTLAIW